jgi:hypothetical protein
MALLIIDDIFVVFLCNFLPRTIIIPVQRMKQVGLIGYKQVGNTETSMSF